MLFEESVKYLYIKDKKSGKIKKLIFSKRAWEDLNKFRKLKEKQFSNF